MGRARSDEGGFTLIELLVAMGTGLIVVFGASALMINALHVTSQVQARVQVVGQARVGLTDLLQQLDSGCLVNDVSPVQAATSGGVPGSIASDDTHLVFVSGVGDSAVTTPTEHVVSITNGALTDVSYLGTGKGSPPTLSTPSTWTFSATPTQTETLMEAASPTGNTPLFRYFSYANPANPTPNSLLGAPKLPTPLTSSSTTGAPAVARVDIYVTAQPVNSANDASSSADFHDSATFRLTAASPLATNYPCD